MLTSDSETPVVSQTTVGTDLLESLEIIPHLRIGRVGKDLVGLSVDDVSLPVEEPVWNLVLLWVLHDCDDTLQLLDGEFTSSLVQVDISLLADQVRVTTTNTLDLCEGEHDLVLSVNIGVEETQNVLD